MKRNVIIILTLTVIIVLITVVVLLIRPYIPKYSWNVNFREKSEQPYGTAYTYKILEKTGVFKKFTMIDKSLTKELPITRENSLYIFIGYYPFYDSLETEHLLKYVSAGNDVMLATEGVPKTLGRKIFNVPDSLMSFDQLTDSVITTRFADTSEQGLFAFHFQFYKRKYPTHWGFVFKHRLEDTLMVSPSKIISTLDNNKVNFWKISYGKGSIYLHADPLLFTNYYMVSEEGYRYLNAVLSVLGSHKTCYWDEYSKTGDSWGGQRSFGQSPLRFILSQRSLRLAYYLALLLILVYLVTKARRIQRPIPIKAENRNTSIRFAEAVGTLHYQSGDHVQLARQMMSLFMSFVRQRYSISTNLQEAVLIEQIARHSEVKKEKIERIFKHFFSIKYNPDPDKIQTIQLHSYLEYFYKNCK